MKPIRVLIVDDHGVMRAGLRALIEAQKDMRVAAEARDGEEAVERAEAIGPDVVVMDLGLPKKSGVEATREIRKSCPGTRVLALTMHDDPAYVTEVMAAGGSGYVVKDALGDELISAIRTVHEGRTYINVSLDPRKATDLLGEQPGAPEGGADLSEREKEVLDLLARGFTNQQIGKRLHLSPKTIGTYRHRISSKLGLDTRADIVRYALKAGILKPDGRN